MALSAAAFFGAAAAAAAAEPDVAPWLRGAAALGTFASKGPAAPSPTFRLETGVETSWLLDGGWALGGALGGVVEADAREAGALGGCGAGPACPTIAGEAVASPLSRLTNAAAARGPVSRASLTAAYVFARGPWGEASIGRDVGAADRFSLAPPTVRAAATAPVDAAIDPSGIGAVRVSAALTGASAKAVALTPRWLGFRAGASFTPRVEGVDLADAPASKGARSFAGRDVGELGLSFDRTWASGLQTTFGAAWARGRSGSGFGTADARAWGAQAGWRGFKVGAAGLEAGLSAAPGRDTRSLALGATFERGSWGFEASTGRMRDQWLGGTLRTSDVAARKTLGDHASIALVGSIAERRADAIYRKEGARSTGARLEISVEL